MAAWDEAVAWALEYPPADLAEAAGEELECLWTDLGRAVREADDGWSMDCNWFTERITQLTSVAGPVPAGFVPQELVTCGVYDAIMRAACPHPLP